MRHGNPYEPRHAAPGEPPMERLVDLPHVPAEAVRAMRRPAPARPVDPDEDSGVSFRDREDGETEIQRVGGRRRFRPEVLLVVVGWLFILAALIKPWPAPPPSASPSPASSVLAAVNTEAPPMSEQPSPVGYPDIPPGDYRFPAPGPDQQAPDASTGITASLTRRWSTVDWTLLNAIDQHEAWGFGTATMPDLTSDSAATPPPPPALSWVAAVPRPNPTVLQVRTGSGVFALNVTWPSSVKVTGITFRYLGGPDNPPYQPPVGFPSFTEVSPLPATQVASGQVPTVIPGSSPGGESAPPASAIPSPTAGPVRSGQFWIPPSTASWNAATTSVPIAWHTLPWPWPNGTYRVTLDTTTGSTAYLLTIQQIA